MINKGSFIIKNYIKFSVYIKIKNKKECVDPKFNIFQVIVNKRGKCGLHSYYMEC